VAMTGKGVFRLWNLFAQKSSLKSQDSVVILTLEKLRGLGKKGEDREKGSALRGKVRFTQSTTWRGHGRGQRAGREKKSDRRKGGGGDEPDFRKLGQISASN